MLPEVAGYKRLMMIQEGGYGTVMLVKSGIKSGSSGIRGFINKLINPTKENPTKKTWPVTSCNLSPANYVHTKSRSKRHNLLISNEIPLSIFEKTVDGRWEFQGTTLIYEGETAEKRDVYAGLELTAFEAREGQLKRGQDNVR